MTKSSKIACLLASVFLLSPAAAVAQSTATTNADANAIANSGDNMDIMGTTTARPAAHTTMSDSALAQTPQPVQEDDHDFPWGLLGLVGLAGLLGRKRRNDDYLHPDRGSATTDNRM